jgi:hypothetical protein
MKNLEALSIKFKALRVEPSLNNSLGMFEEKAASTIRSILKTYAVRPEAFNADVKINTKEASVFLTTSLEPSALYELEQSSTEKKFIFIGLLYTLFLKELTEVVAAAKEVASFEKNVSYNIFLNGKNLTETEFNYKTKI